MSSYHLPLFVGRIFFRCFVMSYFVCIEIFLDIFLIFLISTVLSGLFPQVVFFWGGDTFSFLSQYIPAYFLCFIIFLCFRIFHQCVSSQISYPHFVFLFVFFKGTPVFLQTNFAPVWISSCNSMMFLWVYMLILHLFFRFCLDCS